MASSSVQCAGFRSTGFPAIRSCRMVCFIGWKVSRKSESLPGHQSRSLQLFNFNGIENFYFHFLNFTIFRDAVEIETKSVCITIDESYVKKKKSTAVDGLKTILCQRPAFRRFHQRVGGWVYAYRRPTRMSDGEKKTY